MIQPAILSIVAGCSISTATAWRDPLEAAMQHYAIDNPMRISAFLAQTAQESGGFSVVEENLNYRAKRLLEVFPRYFDAASAAACANQPQAIANRVYANRMGNGSEGSGDGWKYRGRGLIQLTGFDNYRDCGHALGIDLLKFPDKLKERTFAAASAGWFWESRGLNQLADAGRFESITKKVNGGLNGQAERLAIYNRALNLFG